MSNTWKPLAESADALIRKLDAAVWNENKKRYVWRPAPCPQDEGQFEAIARRRDAREGFDE